MGEFGIGQSPSRFEDARLLAGGGCFVEDFSLPQQAHAYVLRSPHAHAVLRGIDLAAAQGAPGVLGVFTWDDLARDGLGTTAPSLPRKRPDGSPMFARPHAGLARGRVRY